MALRKNFSYWVSVSNAVLKISEVCYAQQKRGWTKRQASKATINDKETRS